jgi:hypothetical protein
MLSYLQYLISAKTLHDIHSPFVFKLHNEVTLSSKYYYDFEEIERFFHPLITDKTMVSNLGAAHASKFFFRPTVAQIVQKFEPSRRVAHLLYKLVDFFHPQSIAVLGGNVGLATHYLAKGWHKSRLLSIEPCQALAQLSTSIAKDLPQLRVINTDWQQGTDAIIKTFPQLDFLWLNTRYADSMYTAWQSSLTILHSQSVTVFHLRYRNEAMEQMWKKVIADERVRFSIDLWEVGIVFMDEKQPKQHFVLRW